MSEVQIKSVSIKHDAIMDYLLANPAKKLGEVALYFQVSQAWLSVIIHSDAFQIKLKEKSGEMFSATVVPLREQLLGVAQVGVEKLGEALEQASPISDKEFIAETTDSILKNLGYSPKSAAPASSPTIQQNNFYVADREALAAAREKMRTVPAGDSFTEKGVLIESEAEANNSSEEL